MRCIGDEIGETMNFDKVVTKLENYIGNGLSSFRTHFIVLVPILPNVVRVPGASTPRTPILQFTTVPGVEHSTRSEYQYASTVIAHRDVEV